MLTKKYFSISEACDMCSLAPHKLRYIDKIDKKMSIVKIRGRRYYTLENINYLIQTYSDIKEPIIKQPSIKIENTEIIDRKPANPNNNQINYQFLERIDQLIKNFHTLAERLS
ncbi:MAG: hypothetical protein AAF673_05355 [Pseudomonadota bacterium]